MLQAALRCLLLFSLSLAASNTLAEVNSYGIDCTATPWYSSCGNTDWFDSQNMTQYYLSDDGYTQVDIPFNFTLKNQTYTTSWMMSNGVVTFMSPTNGFCCEGLDVLNTDMNQYTGLPYFAYSIAALWTDLIEYNQDLDGDGINDTGFFSQEIDTNTDGTVDSLRYIWRNISEFSNYTNTNTFDTQIYDSGLVQINHFDINIGSQSVTVGVFGDPTAGEIYQYEYSPYTTAYENNTFTEYNFNLDAACAINPLISTSCSGYAEALAQLIYEQECASDALYDSGCTGYEEAYYSKYIAPAQKEQEESIAGVDETSSSDNLSVTDPVDSLTEVNITGDSTVDEVLRETNEYVETFNGVDGVAEFEAPSETYNQEPGTSQEGFIGYNQEDTGSQEGPEEGPVEDQYLVASIEEEYNEDEPGDDATDVLEPGGDVSDETDTRTTDNLSGVSESGEQDGAEGVADAVIDGAGQQEKQLSPEQQKREKLKEIVTQRAMLLAERISEAASIEEQQRLQAQVAALINFVPGFIMYGRYTVPGGDLYEPNIIYANRVLPENQRGLRNGLAQQLLHERMVEMQYNR